MRLILDTHAFFWWVKAHPRLSRTAIRLVEDMASEVLVSAAVAWAISIKSHIGKWMHALAVLGDIEDAVAESGFRPLAIEIAHARLAWRLTGPNTDPLDRMLAARAQLEDAVPVSADARRGGPGARVV